MFQTAIRRVGIIAATTALAGAAFAGAAAADPGYDHDKDKDKKVSKVTGVGGEGGSNAYTSGGCGLAVGIGGVDVISDVLTGGGIDNDTTSQCNTTPVAGDGGAGIGR